MQHSPFIKTVTLLSFLSLISVFIIYKGGYLDNFFDEEGSMLQTSTNGGNLSQNNTIASTNDHAQKAETRLSSSKSIVITNNISFSSDTPPKQTDTPTYTEEELKLMQSSKSGYIFKPAFKGTDSLKTKNRKSLK